jgi:hypothetical protein
VGKLSPNAKSLIKAMVFLAFVVASRLVPWPAWHTPLLFLGSAVMWIPDGRPRTPLRWHEIALLAAGGAALLAIEFLGLPRAVEKKIVFGVAGIVIILVAGIWWDFLKLTGEIVRVLFGARHMIRDAQAREIAMGRELPKRPADLGVGKRMIYWFLTAEMPWRKRG